jgi:hypothetical protein
MSIASLTGPVRPSTTARSLLAGTAVATAVALGGCHNQREVFEGRPSDQVWTAMVKAAEQPEYNDWHVIENDVWADEKSGRIEIWRLLRRYKDPGGQWARLEDQEWKFAVEMTPTEPAEASFVVRSLCIPSHSWMEADRYFDQVWRFLGGKPTAGDAPSPKESTPKAQPSASDPSESTPEAQQPAAPTPAKPVEPPVDLPE